MEIKPPLIQLLSFNNKIFFEVDSFKKFCDYYLNVTLNMSEEEKRENDFSQESFEGYLMAFDFIKRRVEEESNRFATEVELDGLGLGDNLTKNYDLRPKDQGLEPS